MVGPVALPLSLTVGPALSDEAEEAPTPAEDDALLSVPFDVEATLLKSASIRCAPVGRPDSKG
ncbi:hypothetical protein PtA15_4A836 [Puccinia triticina]|uniref:Uncharacterized protein n=1 Tax=Puccinia triticina TaxID=208348 RepID=A0ABY7CGQ1_9BASI|nr:uncharacterized protein PtA15_4A836 [Puccinia triticina]WAQ84383.1 hypothetical protein PtA15_4A836 [Puccinia triticina]